MKWYLRTMVAAASASLVLASCAPKRSVPAATGGLVARPSVAVATAPVGLDTSAVEWVKVTAPGLGAMLAAVARPQGAGPFPTLLILHGTHGFAREYVRLAQDVARHGMLAVAACWFSGGAGAGARFVTPIPCPEAPPLSAASSSAAQRAVDALVQAVRTLPDARPDQVALFGDSRGGGAALNYVLSGATVQAVVLNSAGYPPELAARAREVRVPILMLHGEGDSPDDGGSAMTDVQMARAFEAALRQAGRQVETKYYAEGEHNGIFTSAAQHDDEVERIAAFLRAHLAR